MKDEQIIALYFARNEDAIGETDKKYGARLLQLAQRILLDQFACEEVRSDTYLKTWNAIPPQRPPVFPAFLSRLTRQGAIDRYRRDGAQKRGAREYLLSLEELGDAVGGEADEALDARLLAESIERYLRTLSPRGLMALAGLTNLPFCRRRKSRCGPEERPVLPTKPMTWPCRTRWPLRRPRA